MTLKLALVFCERSRRSSSGRPGRQPEFDRVIAEDGLLIRRGLRACRKPHLDAPDLLCDRGRRRGGQRREHREEPWQEALRHGRSPQHVRRRVVADDDEILAGPAVRREGQIDCRQDSSDMQAALDLLLRAATPR